MNQLEQSLKTEREGATEQAGIKRPEIEGLRAVAVLSVVLFHADVPYLSGGFLGVDVFFVISGYVITASILRDIRQGKFGLNTFYRRRFLRLYPAAATTTLVTLLATFFILPPDEVLDSAISALYALAAISNIYFWSVVGYFDSAANLKPLLHTWSLGVEEQFYLIWPLTLLLIIRRLGENYLFWFVLCVALVSLVAANLWIEDHSSAVFYLMPFRVFEFAIGMLIAFPNNFKKVGPVSGGIIGIAGLLTIFFSMVFMDSSWAMPSVYSLIPCFGAGAIIYSGNVRPIAVLLSNKVMVYIGGLSYSLYLVHWPISLYMPSRDWPDQGMMLSVCFLIAALQFYYVETPFRQGKSVAGRMTPKMASILTVGIVISAGVSAVYAISTGGLRHRLPSELQKIPSAEEMWKERNPLVRVGQCFIEPDQNFSAFDKSNCLPIEPHRPNVLVVGDSFAADLYGALSGAFPDISFLQATSANCLPVMVSKGDKNCKALMDFIYVEFIKNHRLDGIVLSGSWAYMDLEPIAETVGYLRNYVGNIILAGPPVRFSKNAPMLIFESRAMSVREAENYLSSHRHGADGVNRLIVQKFSQSNLPFINIHETMCKQGSCPLFTDEEKMVYLDFGHLSAAGIKYFGENIRRDNPDFFGFNRFQDTEKK